MCTQLLNGDLVSNGEAASSPSCNINVYLGKKMLSSVGVIVDLLLPSLCEACTVLLQFTSLAPGGCVCVCVCVRVCVCVCVLPEA